LRDNARDNGGLGFRPARPRPGGGGGGGGGGGVLLILLVEVVLRKSGFALLALLAVVEVAFMYVELPLLFFAELELELLLGFKFSASFLRWRARLLRSRAALKLPDCE